jgi:hypothetical protein
MTCGASNISNNDDEHFEGYHHGGGGYHHGGGGYHHGGGGYHHGGGGYHHEGGGNNYMNELFTSRFILVIFAIFILFSVLLAISSSKN